jgi:hypothetical protein
VDLNLSGSVEPVDHETASCKSFVGAGSLGEG